MCIMFITIILFYPIIQLLVNVAMYLYSMTPSTSASPTSFPNKINQTVNRALAVVSLDAKSSKSALEKV